MDLDFPFDYLNTSCKAIAVLFKLKCSQLKKKTLKGKIVAILLKQYLQGFFVVYV